MRFFASLDTTIFGVPYGSGVEVDTAGWTRQQLLSVLNLGVVYPGSVTIGMISDRLSFGGEGVTIETTVDGQTLVSISTVAKPLSFATDVDDELAPAEGDALIFRDGAWHAEQLPAIPSEFADLDDVDISATPEEGQTLVWTVTGWKAVFSAGQNLVDLLDVLYDSASPTDGDVLLWDGVNQTWKNAPATFVGEAGPAAISFVGTWSSVIQYSANPLPAPVVLHNGSSYVATGDSLNKAPDAYPTLWQLLAQKGATGATGQTGAKGDKGDKGDTGATGPANTLSVGTVTTLSTGSSATSTITGVYPNQKINLGIPVGNTGPNGLSAYQVAVNNGFVGTEAEWLASLKGDPGDAAGAPYVGSTPPPGDASTWTINQLWVDTSA